MWDSMKFCKSKRLNILLFLTVYITSLNVSYGNNNPANDDCKNIIEFSENYFIGVALNSGSSFLLTLVQNSKNKNSLHIHFNPPEIVFFNPFGANIPNDTMAYIAMSQVANFSEIFKKSQKHWRRGVTITEKQHNICLNQLKAPPKLLLNTLGFKGTGLSGHARGCYLGSFKNSESDPVVICPTRLSKKRKGNLHSMIARATICKEVKKSFSDDISCESKLMFAEILNEYQDESDLLYPDF